MSIAPTSCNTSLHNTTLSRQLLCQTITDGTLLFEKIPSASELAHFYAAYAPIAKRILTIVSQKLPQNNENLIALQSSLQQLDTAYTSSLTKKILAESLLASQKDEQTKAIALSVNTIIQSNSALQQANDACDTCLQKNHQNPALLLATYKENIQNMQHHLAELSKDRFFTLEGTDLIPQLKKAAQQQHENIHRQHAIINQWLMFASIIQTGAESMIKNH
jgi:hypothetical protein